MFLHAARTEKYHFLGKNKLKLTIPPTELTQWVGTIQVVFTIHRTNEKC